MFVFYLTSEPYNAYPSPQEENDLYGYITDNVTGFMLDWWVAPKPGKDVAETIDLANRLYDKRTDLTAPHRAQSQEIGAEAWRRLNLFIAFLLRYAADSVVKGWDS